MHACRNKIFEGVGYINNKILMLYVFTAESSLFNSCFQSIMRPQNMLWASTPVLLVFKVSNLPTVTLDTVSPNCYSCCPRAGIRFKTEVFVFIQFKIINDRLTIYMVVNND